MVKWALLANAVLIFVVMSAAWLVARRRQRLDTVDAAWGLAFIVPASLAFGLQWQLSTVVAAVLVYIWSIRLTTHLIDRNRARPDDPRYKAFTKKWRGEFWQRAYFSVFLLQGALVWLISLPVILSVGKPRGTALVWVGAGLALWILGFVIEAIADRQLEVFRRDPTHHGHSLQTGLWRYSRHPNYFGELLQWFGIAVVATSVHDGWIGFAGPIVLTLLIVFISGIPPIETRRQHDKEYQAYRRRTSMLIPWRPKRAA